MKKLLLAFAIVFISGCQTTYLTSDGEELVGNSVLGCLAGELFFKNCEAGAVGGAAVTVIRNEQK
mgnify:FL=1|tara:strand:+ start:596 stop:790 length:195 start_codon:yes stop_codon:yes gene_type:complete